MPQAEMGTSLSSGDGRLSAAAMLRWRAQQLNQPLPRLPEACVFTHQASLIRPRRGPFREQALRLLSLRARTEKSSDKSVLLAACSIGAPATAIAIEELAVLGIKRLLVVDIAGSIDAGLQSGSVAVIEAALCRDGTSSHYTDEPAVRADAGLTEALLQALFQGGVEHTRGTVWSTDAVYRETTEQIESARSLGAGLVDMETASVFAVAAAKGIAAAAALVVADELFDSWRPPESMIATRASLKRLMSSAITCLQIQR